jgi:hypothetical protein
MAKEARYRPAAPSDGFGNITVPAAELDLEAEAREYAERWTAQEDDHTFTVGCCNWPTRPATMYAIEAARALCGCADDVALDLLKLAIKQIEEAGPRTPLGDLV